MYVSIEQIQRGLAAYADKELIPKVQGLRKWMIAIASPVILANIGDIAERNSRHLVASGLMSNDGMIDLDRIASLAMEASSKTGAITQEFPIIGCITFDSHDIESIVQCIRMS